MFVQQSAQADKKETPKVPCYCPFVGWIHLWPLDPFTKVQHSGKRFHHDDVIKWKHFSVLLAICAGNSPETGEFPAQRPVTRSFDIFFDLRLNKRLSKQSWGWWFETPSHSLWRHCNDCDILACWMSFICMHFLDKYHVYFLSSNVLRMFSFCCWGYNIVTMGLIWSIYPQTSRHLFISPKYLYSNPKACESHRTMQQYNKPGPRFNISTIFSLVRISIKDKTVVRPSYLYNGNPYTGKAKYFYWDGPRDPCT